MKNLKERGITLIALVITIIVLLILAAVTLNLVVGDNGIITKATEASLQTVISQIQDTVKLKNAEKLTEYHAGNIDEELFDFATNDGEEVDNYHLNFYTMLCWLNEYYNEDDLQAYLEDDNNYEADNIYGGDYDAWIKLRPEFLENSGIKTSYGKGQTTYYTEEKDVFLLNVFTLELLYRDKQGNLLPTKALSTEEQFILDNKGEILEGQINRCISRENRDMTYNQDEINNYEINTVDDLVLVYCKKVLTGPDEVIDSIPLSAYDPEDNMTQEKLDMLKTYYKQMYHASSLTEFVDIMNNLFNSDIIPFSDDVVTKGQLYHDFLIGSSSCTSDKPYIEMIEGLYDYYND